MPALLKTELVVSHQVKAGCYSRPQAFDTTEEPDCQDL